jgi:hypothetical protein
LSLLPEYGSLHPWGGGLEYEYSLRTFNKNDCEQENIPYGVLYYGVSGLPVTIENSLIVGYGNNTYAEINDIISLLSGNGWLSVYNKFKTPDNSGKNDIYLGILIETNTIFNTGGTLYIKDFNYIAADILVQDPTKSGLLIEQNFNSGFIGGIQKLRIYDTAFTAPEVLHNAIIESKNNSKIIVSKGGRIIYR